MTITDLSNVVNMRVSRESGKIRFTSKSEYVTWFAWFYSLWNWSLIFQGVSYHLTFSNRRYCTRASKVGIDRVPMLVDHVNFLNASPVNDVLDNERQTTTCLGRIELDESLNEQTMAIHGVCIFSVYLASSDGHNIRRYGCGSR